MNRSYSLDETREEAMRIVDSLWEADPHASERTVLARANELLEEAGVVLTRDILQAIKTELSYSAYTTRYERDGHTLAQVSNFI